jgi:hypothetical protein
MADVRGTSSAASAFVERRWQEECCFDRSSSEGNALITWGIECVCPREKLSRSMSSVACAWGRAAFLVRVGRCDASKRACDGPMSFERRLDENETGFFSVLC